MQGSLPFPSKSATQIVAACGMQAEERIAADARVRTVCGSGDPNLLRARLTAALTGQRVAALVSFGIAGGLDTGLAPGTPILAPWVIGVRGRWNTDARWLKILAQACGCAVCVGIAGNDLPVGTMGEKRYLRSHTGAAAVDMESHIVAETANEHALPFAIIRVVADSAQRPLPSAALVPLRQDGRPDLIGVLNSLAKKPGQLPALIGIARDTRLAFRSLRRIRRDFGLGFACPDLF